MFITVCIITMIGLQTLFRGDSWLSIRNTQVLRDGLSSSTIFLIADCYAQHFAFAAETFLIRYLLMDHYLHEVCHTMGPRIQLPLKLPQIECPRQVFAPLSSSLRMNADKENGQAIH